jgi:transposase
VGPTRRGKGSKIMAIVNRRSLPLAVYVASASPHEVRLVAPTLDDRFIAHYPPLLIGDLAYDSDPLDAELRTNFGIELIAPHRPARVRPATQDGRSLRRYKRRWVVERFFAWLHNSRRLVVRWERHVENFIGMLQLGCLRILLNRL